MASELTTPGQSAGEKPEPCKVCQHPRGREGSVTAASTTLGTLRQTAAQGCVTCGIFASAIQTLVSKTGDVLEDDWRVCFEFQMSYLGDSLAAYVYPLGLHVSFFAVEYTPWLQDTLPDLPLGRSVPRSTCSDASVEWVKRQLQQCTSSHSSCQPPSSEPLNMPSRIIDIGSSDQDRIYLMDSPDRAEQYACLSYCWGHHPFLTTRFDTIDSYRRRIPWDLLPPTFQDAISFLRKLRIPYLWIDSLCIVQDDSNDWKRESSQMASIYQNAHLVISATKSANAYEGLFSQIGEEFQPHVLPVPTPEGYTEQVFFRRSLTHMRGPTNFGPRRETDLPTLSRGWIFQERLLATRVLHFGPQELLWECQGHSSCQCTVNRVTTPTNAAASFLSRVTWGARALQLKSSFNIRSWGSWSDRELSRCWHSLVEEYSRLHLTHETDIFPAFSGVAKRFQGAFRSEVLAGLWRKSLLADLLWHVQTQGERHGTGPGFWGRPESWRAPSWSWASVKCPVSYIDTSDGLDACCDILEAACEAAGIDPTGEVAGGSLILQGNLIPTDLNYSALSVNEVMPWNLYGLGVTKNKVSNVWADADTSVPGSNHLPQGSEVYCFPVGVGSISKAIECLLLRKVMVEKEAAYGIYERIGLVEVPRAPRDRLDQWVTSFKMSRTIKVI